MTILKPNVGKDLVAIPVSNVYIKVADYGAKFLLKSIKIALGQHTWEWIPLKEGSEVDISGIGDRYCSFDKAINIEINDPYHTVYMFDTFEQAIRNWSDIVYQNSITTKYQGCIKDKD
jgi:hypothetical protein